MYAWKLAIVAFSIWLMLRYWIVPATLIETYLEQHPEIAPDEQSFMKPIEQFVVLQRFFRVALNAALAEQFPRERLISLERATHDKRVTQPTIRWQVENEQQREELKKVSPTEYARWESFEKNDRREYCATP